MSIVTIEAIPFDVFQRHLEDLLASDAIQNNDTEAFEAVAGAVKGGFWSQTWTTAKSVVYYLGFLHHTLVSDERAWLVYGLVLGVTAVSIVNWKKDHKYRGDSKTEIKLAYLCGYISFAIILTAIAYLAVLVSAGPSNWNSHVITEFTVLFVTYQIAKAVLHLSQDWDIEHKDDLDVLPFPGLKPIEAVPKAMAENYGLTLVE